MRVGFGLNIEQHQKLIMTPELRQAITILQLSSLELADYIQQELLENPLLELKEEEVQPAENNSEDSKNEPAEEETFDVDWQEYFQDRSDLGYLKPSHEMEGNQFEHFTSKSTSLAEHLIFQLRLIKLDEDEYEIGEFLIGNIDEDGYLNYSVTEAAKDLGRAESDIERILSLIQSFEPYGVGARNLQECLLIQVRYLEQHSELLEQLVSDHLEDLAKGKLQMIAASLKISVQEVQKLADLLKTLEPKPGRAFFNLNEIKYIVPDVVVERISGEYIILVNDTTAPRLNINRSYRDVLMQKGAVEQEAKKFIEDKLNSASWLIKSIEQRRLTIYKVANCLVELQRDFLDQGVKYLKPLNLKKVAELVGVHESTISRATSNKYIQTPQGIFEMKYFFSSGVEQIGGEGISSESLKKVIKELVANEDPKKPLSDQKITDLLKREGINISRRTVAKYRDEMGILSTAKRKRY